RGSATPTPATCSAGWAWGWGRGRRSWGRCSSSPTAARSVTTGTAPEREPRASFFRWDGPRGGAAGTDCWARSEPSSIVFTVRPHDPIGLVGQVLDGQFHVDAYVGEGGFSTVYKGTSVGLNEPIAVKCLKLPASLGSVLVESFVKRFRDESRIH